MGLYKQYSEVFRSATRRLPLFTDADDADVVLHRDSSGRPVAGLLLNPCSFLYCGQELPAARVRGVTKRPEVSDSVLEMLMAETLREAARRHYAVLLAGTDIDCSVLASSGFCACGYSRCENYTALHKFHSPEYTVVDNGYSAFHELEIAVGCGTIHSPRQYDSMVLFTGSAVETQTISVRTSQGAKAFLFATFNTIDTESGVLVRSLLAENESAAQAALAELRHRVPGRLFSVVCPAGADCERRYLRLSGWLRIVDMQVIAEAMATVHTQLQTAIEPSDGIVDANNGVFIIESGITEVDDADGVRPGLCAPIEVVAAVLFGDPKIGRIFGLPAVRPYLSDI